MNLVFLGTGSFGIPALEALAQSGHRISCVVTSSDKPQGRHQKTSSSPIKSAAERLALPITEFTKETRAAILQDLQSAAPEFLIVVDFGYWLPGSYLSLPKFAPLNIHPSLLPKHRGAAPVPWTLLSGDAETGVTLIRMTEKMDAGDIVSQITVPVEPEEDAQRLERRLSLMGAELLLQTLSRWASGMLEKPRPQNEEEATHARKLTKEDALLDFSLPADLLSRRVRALKGWPGTFACIRGKRILVHRAKPVAGSGTPGTILSADASGLSVATGQGALCLLSVQLEGKKELSVEDFLRGFSLRAGERFE